MYCPLLCIKPANSTASFCQCLGQACAWWVVVDSAGKCAINQLGVYAGNS